MKGAEIALVAGTRVKVGSGEDCDIVIADASLAAAAFELDVSEDAVTLITPDGEAQELKDFEIREFGSTAVAVGPAAGAWGELYRPEPEASKEGGKGSVDDEKESEGAPEEKDEEGDGAGEKKGVRRLGCLVALLTVLVVVLLLAFLGYRHRERLGEFAGRWTDSASRQVAGKAEESPSVADIAKTHGLRVEERDGRTVLVGNLKRRTERLAIRAMTLAADRTVKFDLTDDQSLKTSVADTLSLVAGGRLTVVSVTNRVAEIKGRVAGPGELASVLKVLNQDVPQLVSCVTTGVRAAIAAEASPAGTGEQQEGTPSPAAKNAGRSARPSVSAVANMPVAGILTTPYPCVVLTDGSRCLEGSRIGGLELKRITAEELVFKAGEAELKWRP